MSSMTTTLVHDLKSSFVIAYTERVMESIASYRRRIARSSMTICPFPLVTHPTTGVHRQSIGFGHQRRPQSDTRSLAPAWKSFSTSWHPRLRREPSNWMRRVTPSCVTGPEDDSSSSSHHHLSMRRRGFGGRCDLGQHPSSVWRISPTVRSPSSYRASVTPPSPSAIQHR